MDTQVLIIGAGPTGLTLAVDLARRGVPFRIVDAAPRPFHGSRGKGLQPRSMEVFDDLGLVDEILANGRFHVRMRHYRGHEVLRELDMHEGRHPTPDRPYASTLIIPQFRVEQILRDRLGGAVEYGTALTGLHQDDEHVSATLTGGETVRARYLVACDGGKSFVRKHLGVGFLGETWEDQRLLVGDVRATGLDREYWHGWGDETGFVGLCPLPSTDLYQFQATGDGEPTLEHFRAIIGRHRDDVEITEVTWSSLYRVNIRMVDRFRVGRVFLAGDAAHVHSPAGGQGMNTGIQDAYNLGWKLGIDALLDTYESERKPVAESMLGITTRLHTSGRFERDEETLQLNLSYRDDSDAPGLQAGDRMPDGLVEQGRVFDLLRGTHFTTLERPDGPVLVRPDGYVAAVGRSAIDDYFRLTPAAQRDHRRVAAPVRAT